MSNYKLEISIGILLILGVVLPIGCNSSQPSMTKEQEGIYVKQEQMHIVIVNMEDRIRVLHEQLREEGLKGKYLEAESIVLDKQVLQLIKILEEYTNLGKDIGRASEVDSKITWKFVVARDNLVKEQLKELVKRREEYRKDVNKVWEKYNEQKRR